MVDRYLTVARAGVYESEIKRSRFLCALAPAATRRRRRRSSAASARSTPAPPTTASRTSSAPTGGSTARATTASPAAPRAPRCCRCCSAGRCGTPSPSSPATTAASNSARAAWSAPTAAPCRAALDEIGTVERRRLALLTVTVDHQRAGRLENDLRAAGHTVRDVTYAAAVTFHLGVPAAETAAFRAWLADATSGDRDLRRRRAARTSTSPERRRARPTGATAGARTPAPRAGLDAGPGRSGEAASWPAVISSTVLRCGRTSGERWGQGCGSERWREIPAHLGLAPGAVLPPGEPARRPAGVPRPPGGDGADRAGGRRARRRRRLRPGRAAADRRRALRRRAAPAGRARRAHRDDLRQPRLGPPARRRRAADGPGRASTCAPTPRPATCPSCCPTTHGEVAVYGLPYLEPALVRAEFGAERADHTAVLGAAMDRVRADLAARPAGTRSVVLAHAFVTGAAPCDSERDITAGGVEAVPAALFDGVDYVALGHLHGCQTISERVRYSGSPLAYSFSEEHHRKSMWLVDLGPAGEVAAERIDTPVPRPLARLRGTPRRPARRPGARARTPTPGWRPPSPTRSGRTSRWPRSPSASRTSSPSPSRPSTTARRPARLLRPAAARPQRPADRRGLRRPRPRQRARRRANAPCCATRSTRYGPTPYGRNAPDATAPPRTHRLRPVRRHPERRLRRALRRRALPAARPHRRGQDLRPGRGLLRALRPGARRPARHPAAQRPRRTRHRHRGRPRTDRRRSGGWRSPGGPSSRARRSAAPAPPWTRRSRLLREQHRRRVARRCRSPTRRSARRSGSSSA